MTDRADGGGALAVDAVLSDLDDALHRLSDLALWQLPDAALTTVAAALDRARRRAEGQTVRLLGEVDGRGIPAQDGTRTTGAWLLSVVPDLRPAEAGALGRRAEKLYRSFLSPELAPTREAVAAGVLRPHQEKLIVATVEQVTPPHLPADHPEAVSTEVVEQAQQLLVEYAPVLSSRDFERLVTELRHTLDPTADDRLARDEQAQHRRRTLVMATESSGMTFVQGLLSKECGAALRAALDAWSAPQPAEDGTPDPRSPGQRRHDALQRLAETTLATNEAPTTHGSPTRVIVRVTAETLAAAAGPRGNPPAELDDGTPISRQTLTRMLCDAEITPILLDPLGQPLDVGRTQRLHTPKQRLAMAERDRGCTWAHCTAPASWCQAHHLTPWQHGGRTSVDDAALLCGRHHRHVHATGARGRVAGGRVVWDTGGPPGHDPPSRHESPHRATHLIRHLVRQWLTSPRQ